MSILRAIILTLGCFVACAVGAVAGFCIGAIVGVQKFIDMFVPDEDGEKSEPEKDTI